MENVANNNGTNSNNSTAPEATSGNTNGGVGQGGDLASLLFGAATEEENHEGTEGSGEPQLEGSEDGEQHEPDDSTTTEGGAGDGETEGEEVTEAPEVWEYDGKEYTVDQVGEAIKDREIFQRFNESITPLVEGVRQYGETAKNLQIAAQTETEKAIKELTTRLNSGKLDSREYQQTHQLLVQAKARMDVLESAVQQEKKQREQTLNAARMQNARQVATNLVRAGWTKEQLVEAEQIARGVFTPELYADAFSSALMELIRDAAAHRKTQSAAEAKLREMGKKAVQVKQKTPGKKLEKKQDKSLGSLVWG